MLLTDNVLIRAILTLICLDLDRSRAQTTSRAPCPMLLCIVTFYRQPLWSISNRHVGRYPLFAASSRKTDRHSALLGFAIEQSTP